MMNEATYFRTKWINLFRNACILWILRLEFAMHITNIIIEWNRNKKCSSINREEEDDTSLKFRI